jgi:CheY-like chemotaxis protein
LDMDQKQSHYADLKELAGIARNGAELSQNFLSLGTQAEEQPQAVSLNQAIKKVITLLEKTFPKTIHFESSLEPYVQPIQVIPTLVEQLLFNLCLNARDAMPDGGKLLLKTENVTVTEKDGRGLQVASPGDYVQLTVADTGYGMAPEVQARIYEPLYTTKEPGQGTGLGLAMVLLSVKKYHGFIHCESKPGGGTSFHIFLPSLKAEPFSSPDKKLATPLVGGRETILMVDDDEVIRQLSTRILNKFGYTVLTAGCGDEAVELFRQKQDSIDLIILDLNMPGMDGCSCLEALLELDPQARVIISSGQVENPLTSSDGPAGTLAFLNKPYSVGKLLSVVRTAMDQPQPGAGNHASTVTAGEDSGQAEEPLG